MADKEPDGMPLNFAAAPYEPVCCETVCTGNFCTSCGKPVEPKPTNFYFLEQSNGLLIRNHRHKCIGRLLWDKNRKPDQAQRAWIEHICDVSRATFRANGGT
jgi:hypothetical protein